MPRIPTKRTFFAPVRNRAVGVICPKAGFLSINGNRLLAGFDDVAMMLPLDDCSKFD